MVKKRKRKKERKKDFFAGSPPSQAGTGGVRLRAKTTHWQLTKRFLEKLAKYFKTSTSAPV